VCITTNQGGIGLGFYGPDLVERVHALMTADVESVGGRLDALYFCPHHPEATSGVYRGACDCRKPRPGMVRQAMKEFDIDMSRSFVVGDKLADIDLAHNVGARGILVRTGYGEAELVRHHGEMPRTAFVADTVMEAAAWILADAGYPKVTV
jgi:D-glycero-D-manno-heptose 1,7-bisphosphate phosphatase